MYTYPTTTYRPFEFATKEIFGFSTPAKKIPKTTFGTLEYSQGCPGKEKRGPNGPLLETIASLGRLGFLKAQTSVFMVTTFHMPSILFVARREAVAVALLVIN